MDDLDGNGGREGTAWWREADPREAHLKYLRMHRSPTNRSKIAVTERLLGGCDFAGKAVLEYGCGGGYFTVWMAKRGATVTAIELNPKAIGAVNFYAAQEGVAERVRVVEGDAERDTVPGSYDFVFAKDIIEHLDDDGPFFRRLAEQLRPEGCTYIATQNDHSLNYLLEGAYERLYQGNAGWYGWDRTHRRFYNASLLARRLTQVGIVPERWGSSYLFPWRFVTRRLTGKVRPWAGWTRLDQTFGTIAPFSRWGWSIMVIGRKRGERASGDMPMPASTR
jgi:2-polyprenyl-6-hydroxyphenyl methylase/3-demethylubiquinone-9 3-methyltransferase